MNIPENILSNIGITDEDGNRWPTQAAVDAMQRMKVRGQEPSIISDPNGGLSASWLDVIARIEVDECGAAEVMVFAGHRLVFRHALKTEERL